MGIASRVQEAFLGPQPSAQPRPHGGEGSQGKSNARGKGKIGMLRWRNLADTTLIKW